MKDMIQFDANKFIDDVSSDGATVSSIVNKFKLETNSIIDSIRKFFSTSCGEGAKIKDIYSKVSDYATPLRRVSVIDLNLANHKYEEYITGMKEYINNEIHSIPETRQDDVLKKIQEFSVKDKEFIDRLFTSDSKMKYDVPVQDALGNLEVLIDYIDFLNCKNDKINDIVGMFDAESLQDDPIALELIKLFVSSIIRYSEELLRAETESFNKIDNAVNAHIVIPKLNKEIEPAVSAPVKDTSAKFILF